MKKKNQKNAKDETLEWLTEAALAEQCFTSILGVQSLGRAKVSGDIGITTGTSSSKITFLAIQRFARTLKRRISVDVAIKNNQKQFSF